jgi:hypothetical protein
LWELGKVKPPRRILVELAEFYDLDLDELDPVQVAEGGDAA